MKRTDLLNALEQVKPGLASKELIEQTTAFAFIKGKVVTYNDEISISCPIEGLEVEGAVQADELYKFLNKVKVDDIEMTATDTEVRIKAGKSKVGLVLHQEVTLPLEAMNMKGKWEKLPEDFIPALKFVLFTCSSDMSRPILTNINVRKDGVIESSDAFRITQYHIPKMETQTFLLPATAARELVRYEVTRVRHSGSWIHFRTKDRVVFSCRIFEESFPDTTSLIKVEGGAIKFPSTVANILDRAFVFAKRDHYSDALVKIELADRKIMVSAKSPAGWFEETTPIQYRGDPISFAINPAFLSEGVERLRICILSNDRRKIKFEGENWIHITMLMDDK